MSDHSIRVTLDEMLELRGMTLTELAVRIDISLVNLSILKTGKARAVRFSTLTRICRALDCEPGDLLALDPPQEVDLPTGRAIAPRPLLLSGEGSRCPARGESGSR